MGISTDSDSTWTWTARPLSDHEAILEAMLARMESERHRLPADALAERVLVDRRIRNVVRDLRLIRQRRLGLADG